MSAMFICPQDNQSFPSPQALKDHKDSGHRTKGEPIQQDVNPAFLQTLKEIEEDQKKKSENANKNLAPDGTELKLPELKPLELVYKWEGNCPKCRGVVETIMIDTEAGYFAICFCLKDKQIKSMKVAKLENAIIQPKKEK